MMQSRQKGNEKEFSGVLEFHDVGFAYDGAKEEALSDISFTARPGKQQPLSEVPDVERPRY